MRFFVNLNVNFDNLKKAYYIFISMFIISSNYEDLMCKLEFDYYEIEKLRYVLKYK